MKVLAPAAAKVLFCRSVASDPFRWAEANPDLQKVTVSVVDACAGLPLALIIMGAALQDEVDLEEWEVRGLVLIPLLHTVSTS